MSEAAAFAGRFHPLLVHFPIALLIAAALLQGLAAWHERRRPDATSPLRPGGDLLLALGALGALAAAAAGWLLGSSGGYAGDTFERHKWLGLTVAAVAMLAFAAGLLRARGRLWARAQALGLAAAVLLLAPAGHFGATLTHGDGYLTEHAPAWLQGLAGGRATAAARGPIVPERTRIFAAVVQPILQTHCVDCHGPVEARGGLRLDSPEGLAKGGDSGPAIVAGRAAASDLVRRLFLPPSHEDAMPPRERRPLSPGEAAVLGWWIDQGARTETTLADAEILPQVRPVIEALLGPLPLGGPTLPVADLRPADGTAIAAARAKGFSVEPVADGVGFVQVHAINAVAPIGDGDLAVLGPLAPHVLWLDLGGTAVGDGGLTTIARLTHLTRLSLARTAVTDRGLEALAPLAHLEYLNLYGTAISDAGLEPLGRLGRLRTLYVWQTGVTPAGASRLRSAHPRLTVDTGLAPARSPADGSPPADAATAAVPK